MGQFSHTTQTPDLGTIGTYEFGEIGIVVVCSALVIVVMIAIFIKTSIYKKEIN